MILKRAGSLFCSPRAVLNYRVTGNYYYYLILFEKSILSPRKQTWTYRDLNETSLRQLPAMRSSSCKPTEFAAMGIEWLSSLFASLQITGLAITVEL